jgi:hypothetical protein
MFSAMNSENFEDNEDSKDFDEIGLFEYLRQNDDIDGLDTEETLSMGLIDIDELVPPPQLSEEDKRLLMLWLEKRLEGIELTEF